MVMTASARIRESYDLLVCAGLILGLLLLVAAGARSADEQSMYQFALRLYEDGEYELALKQLEQLLAQYPGGKMVPDALFLMGSAYSNLGRYKQSCAVLERYTNDFKSGQRFCEALVLLGSNQERMGHYAQAEKTLASLLSQQGCSKQFEEAVAALAELFYVQGRLGDAIGYYERLFPQGYTGRINERLFEHYADALLRSSQLKKAKRAFKALSRKASDAAARARGLFSLAVCDYLLGDYKESEKLFSKYLRKFPNSDRSRASKFGVIWSVFKQKDYERAASLLGEYQSGMESQIAFASSVIDARVAMARGDYDGAQQMLLGLLQNDPAAADPVFRRELKLLVATCREAMGEYREAVSTYREMLAQQRSARMRYELRFRLAKALLEAGEVSSANMQAEQLVSDEPFGQHTAECKLLLARASRAQKEVGEALERYRSIWLAEKASPLAAQARLEAADMLIECGRAADAIPILGSMPKPGNLPLGLRQRTMFLLGKAFWAIKAYENSDATLERFLQRYPDSRLCPEAFRLRALSLLAIGNAKEALKCFEASDKAARLAPPAQATVLGTLRAFASLGQWQKCKSYLAQLRQTYRPDGLPSRQLDFWACFVKEKLHRYSKAAECFEKLAEEADDRDFGLLCLIEGARSLLKDEQPKEAARLLAGVTKGDWAWPYGPVAEEMLRKCWLALGDFKRSVACVGEFVDSEPGASLRIDRAYERVVQHYDDGEFSRAARIAKRYLRVYPNPALSGRLRLLLARSLFAQNRLGPAEDALRPLLAQQTEPRLRQLCLALMGDIFYRRGKPRKAIEFYAQLNPPVFERRDDEARLLFRIAEAYRKIGGPDEALRFYKRLVTGYGDILGMCREFVSVGDNLRKMGEFELAKKALSIVIADQSCEVRWVVEARFWLAYTLQQQRRYDEAILKYLNLVYTHTEEVSLPWVVSARANIGRCYEAKGQPQRAIAAYQKIIEKYPDTIWSKQARARIAELTSKAAKQQDNGKQ